MILNKWRLGLYVLGRLIVLALALAIVAVLLSIGLYIPLTAFFVIPDPYGPIIALVLAAILALFLLPLAMYWVASWTGYLQEIDRKEFDKEKKKRTPA